MLKAAFLLSPDAFASAYGRDVFDRLRPLVETVGVITPAEKWRLSPELLRDVEVIFSGWGAPRIDAEFLAHVPRLKAIFYAGGSVRYFATDEFWSSGIRITTAQAANAIPVSEYTAATIVLGLKRFWHYARVTRETRTFPLYRPMRGGYQSIVGLISYGAIARLVRQRLFAYDYTVIVHDPFLSEADAVREKVTRVDLAGMFATADVVSLHTPLLRETKRLITGEHFASMKTGAVFINTARGEVVDELAMIACLQRRTDLQAVLDVTEPEPPESDSPLYSLPNVVLTPHLAGSVGPECLRMGHAMVDEFERFQAGLPLQWEITAAEAELQA